MEPRTVVAVLRLFVEINLLLVVAFALERVIFRREARPTGRHRERLRFAQAAFLLAFVLPLLARALPQGALSFPAVQVWSSMAADTPGTPGSHVVPVALPGGRRPIGLDGRLLQLALAAMACGAAIRLGWLIGHLVRVRRSLEALPSIRRLGRVVVAAAPDPVPFSAWCFGRAYVVVPETTLLDPSRYGLAVRHELVHHRHRDTVWIQLFEVGRAVSWWNPVMGSWARRFTELMELACDESLVRERKVDPRAYARCLLDTAQAALAPRRRLATAGMAAEDRTLLRRRIVMIVAPQPPRRRRAVVAPLGTLLILAGSALAIAGPVHDRAIDMDRARELALRAETSDFPVVMNERVLERLNRFVGTPQGREFLARALARMPAHRTAIERRLAEAAMPSSLLAVPLVESGFHNNAGLPTEPTMAPGMRGAGLWMFIPQTAIRYGLVVDPARGIDERLDVAKETQAAIAYFDDLHREFGDWHLALAAYNQGEAHVARAIAEGGARDPFALAEQGRLNDYLATVMAGVVILANPEILD